MNADDVWEFTVSAYGRDGVAPLCLELQDRVGLDVNMLLFLFWLGRQGLAPHSIAALETAVRDWCEQVILPLRQTRRFLRNAAGERAQALRNRIKSDELQAERIEQELLCAAVNPVAAGDGFAGARAYLSPTRFDLSQDECDSALTRLAGAIGAA